MSSPIVDEKPVVFKDLEQYIFNYVCILGRETTKLILEKYDLEICATRDTSRYRNVGFRTTTIKTVYGEVTYPRRLYRTVDDDGKTRYVFLLDEMIQIDRIGLISVNLAEKIAEGVTEGSFRKAAAMISATTGQTVSHGGAWNLAQSLGERVIAEEEAAVSKFNAGELSGTRKTDVLFEEMDGVWLSMQGAGHKKIRKQEMKVATTYEGWDEKGALVGKKVFAGMDKSDAFHDKREAQIESVYDIDFIKYRILNGDGAGWIKSPYATNVTSQTDSFHVHEAIKKHLSKDPGAVREAERLYGESKPEELIEYISTYADSIDNDDPEDKRAEMARELHKYLSGNREGLVPYKKRIKDLPSPPKGVIYKNMGVQENQNCTVITLRMKGKRRRWSHGGADNMAKLLYRKVNGELSDTVNRYCEKLIFNVKVVEETLKFSAAQACVEPGKRDAYFDRINVHVPLRDAAMTASRKAFLDAFF